MEELDNKYRQNNFKVPSSYFGDFEDKVFEQLKSQEAPQPVPLKVWRKKGAWLAAAGLALISSIAYISLRTSSADATGSPLSFEYIDPIELAQYENEVELSEDEFEEIIPASTIDSIYAIDILQVSNTGFTPQELEDLEQEYTALDEETDI